MKKIPDELREALDAAGPWQLQPGAKHYKIKVNGRLVGIYPKSVRQPSRQDLLNTIAQVRRAAAQEPA